MQNKATPKITTLSVQLTSVKNSSSFTQGNVRIQFWDRKERFRRAAIAWIACWIIAIAVIPFPLIHLIVPPVLLLGGPILASIIYNQKDVILGGEGVCPNCGKPMQIVRGSLQWPISDLCTECNEETKIRPLNETVPAT